MVLTTGLYVHTVLNTRQYRHTVLTKRVCPHSVDTLCCPHSLDSVRRIFRLSYVVSGWLCSKEMMTVHISTVTREPNPDLKPVTSRPTRPSFFYWQFFPQFFLVISHDRVSCMSGSAGLPQSGAGLWTVDCCLPAC